MDKYFRNLLYIIPVILLLSSCQNIIEDTGKINVVTTTNILTELVEHIGKDSVDVKGLMGPGVDPHLYKASEGDVFKLYKADVIFYNGLHLEGKMVDIFEGMQKQNKTTIPLGEALDKSQLRQSKEFGGNYDPHVWFNIAFYKEFARETTRVLAEYEPESKEYFNKNLKAYLKELDRLEDELHNLVSENLPKKKRRLVTAHDAFSYFGKSFDFDVIGLQGISTSTEAGAQDVRKVRDYILEHQVNSIFIENSVPRRTIEALQKSVENKGDKLFIGGMLYSDSLGDPGTDEGTYIGMFRYNVETIINGLK